MNYETDRRRNVAEQTTEPSITNEISNLEIKSGDPYCGKLRLNQLLRGADDE